MRDLKFKIWLRPEGTEHEVTAEWLGAVRRWSLCWNGMTVIEPTFYKARAGIVVLIGRSP